MHKQLRDLSNDLDELDALVHEREQSFGPLKKDNEAKIIWADEDKKSKTEYSIVYLHGFAGSHADGDPWHRAVARHFNCNLYLARLHSHGLKGDDFFEGFSYRKLIASAVDACLIGQKIGKNVLVMGTSVGASLALSAAGSSQCPVSIKGLMLISPLIHFYGYQSLFLENKPGRFISKIIKGGDYKYTFLPELTTYEKQFWYPWFPLHAAFTLGKMIEKCVTPALFSNVTCPVFLGYYFKDQSAHDLTVSPHAVATMADQLGTPEEAKRVINFTDSQAHVIGNAYLSESVPELIVKTVQFLKDKIKLSGSESR